MRTRLTALLAAACLMILAPAASAQSGAGLVTVLHGIPRSSPGGVNVDVWVNGNPTLTDFEPKTVADPLELPAGTYDVEIFAAGADPAAEDPIISGSLDLEAGANLSVIAHLDNDVNPTLGVFPNDISKLAGGQARLTVRHTARAPAVDVLANGDIVFADLTNGQEGVADLPAGTIEPAIARASDGRIVLPAPVGPAEVDLGEGVNTILYAIGWDEDDSLDLLIQTISGLHTAPSGVESGTGGLKAADQQSAAPLPWIAALAALALAAIRLSVRRAALSRR